jgi:hypothetical protein
LFPVTCFAVACAVVDFEFDFKLDLKGVFYRLNNMSKTQEQDCFIAILLFAFALIVVMVEQEISNALTLLSIFPYAFTFLPLVVFYIIVSYLYWRRKTNKPKITLHNIREKVKEYLSSWQ